MDASLADDDNAGAATVGDAGDEYDGIKVAELCALLVGRGLASLGAKPVLIDSLRDADAAAGAVETAAAAPPTAAKTSPGSPLDEAKPGAARATALPKTPRGPHPTTRTPGGGRVGPSRDVQLPFLRRR